MIKVNFTNISKKDEELTRITMYKNKNINKDFLQRLRDIKGIIETKRTIKIIYEGNIEDAARFYKNI